MREKILFNSNWKFHAGDIHYEYPAKKGPVYSQSKTETELWGPASYHYFDGSDSYVFESEACTKLWETVDLPHDYIISQVPDKKNNEALGFFKYHNAWYRKHFNLSENDKNKRITLYFEAVATHATVYVNGCLAARNFCGYNSFEVDISDFVHFDKENVVAVYTDTSKQEGWWYAGGGIYRHVWLIKTDKVAVDLYGVYVRPEKLDDRRWNVPIETTVRNDRDEPANVKVRSEIIDSKGKVVAVSETTAEIEAFAKKTAVQEIEVISPKLWDIDNPYLYFVKTTIIENGKEIDTVQNRFGFRTIRFDANEGFFLNERPVKIKGVCCHQDYGLTGKAVPDRVQRYKIRLMKEMGANGFRTVHYPQSEATMDALDEMGFLVMNETRWFSSNADAMNTLEMLVKRDRNRPSVIMWSIANEEPFSLEEKGLSIAKKMINAVKKLDSTRPVTAALSHNPENSKLLRVLDVIGINYNLNQYDKVHLDNPDKPIVASECCASGTTRGWYLPDAPNRGYISAYDHDTNSWFLGREKTWKHISARDWVCGGYQWAGIEHRGEAAWPRLCSQSGAVDMYLQKKDAFYQNLSHWSDKPMVHILPHWNHEGREGEVIPVWVYTNCQEVELFLNGKTLGKQHIEKFGHGQWLVEYIPGKLTAKGISRGKVVCEDIVETTGRPVALKLRLEDEGVRTNDVAIITCYCVDEKGRFVPDACPFVSFDCNSIGAIVATGSDIADHVPPNFPDRKMRAGLCSVLVKTKDTPGILTVYARAEGLRCGRLDISIKK